MGTAEALPTSSCLIPPFFLPFHSPSLTRRHLPCRGDGIVDP